MMSTTFNVVSALTITKISHAAVEASRPMPAEWLQGWAWYDYAIAGNTKQAVKLGP